MSYMGGGNYVSGGQIFPNNQNYPQNHIQRQFQVIQMQMQLQQKLQMQKQQALAASARNQNNEDPKGPGHNSNAKGKPLPGGGAPNLNKNQPNSNVGPKPGMQNDNKSGPNQNQTNSNQGKPQNQKEQDKGPNKINTPSKMNSPLPNNSKPSNENQAQNRSTGPGPQQKGDKLDMVSSTKQEEEDNSNKDKKSRFGNKPNNPNFNQSGPSANQGSLMGAPPSMQQDNYKKDVKTEPESQSPKTQGNQGKGNFGYQQHQGQGHDHYGYQNQGRSNDQYGSHAGQGRPNDSHPQNQGRQNHYNDRNENFERGQYRGNQSQFQEGSFGGNSNYNRHGGNQRPPQNQPGRPGVQQDRKPPVTDRLGGGDRGPYRPRYGGQSLDRLKDKALALFEGPIEDLPDVDITEKKFNAYAKLFIGNVPRPCEQEELTALFKEYGEIGSVYLNKDSSFAFINFDFKANAAKAMRELDGTPFKNRHLKVRFATISEGIRVKNLSPYVSNELLHKAFSIFGTIESARVVVDDRGNPKGEAIVIFKEKKIAVNTIKKCQEECFFLSGAMRPVIVLPLEPSEDNVEGLPEKLITKNDEFYTERQIGPHFADKGSFEFDFGTQWKQLYDMYEEKKSILDRDFQIELERLEKKMVLAKVEYETDKLRKELAQREAESAQLRRHFNFEESIAPSPLAPPQSPMKDSKLSATGASGGYDSYAAPKRPLEQGYDSAYSGPYDAPYDNYDRGNYNAADYDRAYEQGYGGYGRDEYRRDPGYSHENPYDRQYERNSDLPPERPMYDNQPDQGYASNTADAATAAAPPPPPAAATTATTQGPPHAAEAYKAPNKRPRY